MKHIWLIEHQIPPGMMDKIRSLIATSFDEASATSYFGQCPQLRLLLTEGEEVVGHTALYHRSIAVGGSAYMIFGITDHCVQPDRRQEGHGHRMIKAVEDYAANYAIDFLLVMARFPEYYIAQGYTAIAANCRWLSIHGRRSLGVMRRPIEHGLMYKAVHGSTWPAGEVDLLGTMI